jgi:hypothetical protein
MTNNAWSIRHPDGSVTSFMPRRRGRLKTARIFRRSTRKETSGSIVCLFCGVRLRCLMAHLRYLHGMTPTQYRQSHPGAQLREASLTNTIVEKVAARRRSRRDPNHRCSECGQPVELGSFRYKRGLKTCSEACLSSSLARQLAGRACPTCHAAVRGVCAHRALDTSFTRTRSVAGARGRARGPNGRFLAAPEQ